MLEKIQEQKNQLSFAQRVDVLKEKLITDSHEKIVSFYKKNGLDISEYPQISDDKVKFEINDMFDISAGFGGKWDVETGELTVYLPSEDAIVEDNRQSIQHTLIHEMIHSISRQRIVEKIDGIFLGAGFHTVNLHDKDDHVEMFFGALDEALVEFSAIKITGFKSGTYINERNLFKHIVQELSSDVGAEYVMRLFMKSHLGTWDKELKSMLLDTFGTDALKILSEIQTDDLDDCDRREWLYRYFTKNK